jgi:DNA-binding NtrC family response regulator
LRVLESGEFEPIGSSKTYHVDVRVFSATNSDLSIEVGRGNFRQDLLYRLNTVEIRVPPLRERKEDIPLLAGHFLRGYVTKYRKPVTGFDTKAMQALCAYSWPGNVRELDHTIERAVLMADSTLIQSGNLSLASRKEDEPQLENMTLEDMERWAIRKAMNRFDGDISKTADALGLSRGALYRRLEKYQIQ